MATCSQDGPVIETLLRQADETWSHATFEGIDATARLRSLEIDLPLSAIYGGVVFQPSAHRGDS